MRRVAPKPWTHSRNVELETGARRLADAVLGAAPVHRVTVPCPGGCGGQVRAELDTDGNGQLVERAEPCRVCQLGRAPSPRLQERHRRPAATPEPAPAPAPKRKRRPTSERERKRKRRMWVAGPRPESELIAADAPTPPGHRRITCERCGGVFMRPKRPGRIPRFCVECLWERARAGG